MRMAVARYLLTSRAARDDSFLQLYNVGAKRFRHEIDIRVSVLVEHQATLIRCKNTHADDHVEYVAARIAA